MISRRLKASGVGIAACVAMLACVGLVGCAQPEESELAKAPAQAPWMTFESPLGAGTFEEVRSFGDNPGNLKMYKYVPPGIGANAPLMVAMHPCTLNATAYRASGFENIADEYGFYVLYPEQQGANNPAQCFNWAGEYGDPTNLRRGEGENQSIISMVNKMKSDHDIDDSRVFAAGHSGGAAQTALMLATWPDVFAGGAMFAGIPYNCTTNFSEVSGCLTPGRPQSAEEWGRRAREGHPQFNGTYPKVSVWHGTGDSIVRPVNATELIEQWTNVHGTDATADAQEQVDGHTRYEYRDGNNQVVAEFYEIAGGGHGTFVKPGEGCGSTGAYMIDAGICSAFHVARFFGLTNDGMMPGDTTNPSVNVASPTNGQDVSGNVSVSITATDNVGVERVELFVNGQLEATLSSAPYTHSWNTAGLPNGAYALRAVAYDAAGNNTTDDDTSVTISGGVEDTTNPTVSITSPQDGASVNGLVSIGADAADNFSIRSVTFLVDGEPIGEATNEPYQIAWEAFNADLGQHTIVARAADAAGNTAEDSITVTVAEVAVNDPPTVSFANLSEGQSISGLLTVKVDAEDADGIDQGLLFAGEDAELIGADYNPPLEFLIDTAILPEGQLALAARVFDTTGNVGVAQVTVNITRNPADNPNNGGTGNNGTPDIENPGNGGNGEPISVGKSFWGCSSAGGAGPLGGGAGAILALMALVALGAGRRWRKVVALAAVSAALVGCGDGDDIFIVQDGDGNNDTANNDAPNNDAPNNAGDLNLNSAQDVFNFFEDKTMIMSGENIPSHPNGFNENINFGQATQCYASVSISQLAQRWTVRSELGVLNDAPETGDVGTCDRNPDNPIPLEFVSTAVLIENVRDNGACFDVTATYPGFSQEGRAMIMPDGRTVVMELYFKDQATGHRCADGDVGEATVTLNMAAFEGNALQTYIIQN